MRVFLRVVAVSVGGSLASAGCGSGDESSGDAPLDWRQPAVDLELGPVSTFAQHCASCHGEGGSLYPRPFANQGEALREKVEEMMYGPAGLDPSEADVEAMVRYHLSIRASTPFVVATNAASVAAGEARTLVGEATEGAMVRVKLDEAWRDARLGEGVQWSIGEVAGLPVMIDATAGGSSYRVEVGE